MHRLRSPSAWVSYDRYGEGPPLVLVHGSFSNHVSNWELVKPLLENMFTVYAVARRGRGETDATEGHSVVDEGADVVAVLAAIGEPAFLLGHSYGGQVVLAAAALAPERLRKVVLYEPPWPSALDPEAAQRLEALGQAGQWDTLATTFFRDLLAVPAAALDDLRSSPLWPAIVADARATLGDLRALLRYEFVAARFGVIACPVLLQTGTESPRDLYVTDALAAAISNARVEGLPGQAHEGMTTAPEMYAAAVARFLLA